MTSYILHDDQYAKGNFDLEVTVSAGTFPIATALNVTDPREYNSTYIQAPSFIGNAPAQRSMTMFWQAKKNTDVDYIAFNKHSLDLVESGYKLISYISFYKQSTSGFLTQLAPIINGSTITNRDNIVIKFDSVTLNAGDKIRVLFSLNKFQSGTGVNWRYGSTDLRLSYVQIGKSTELRELQTPLNIPYGVSYEAKHHRSDTGLVISTSSKVLPSKIDFKLKNQTKNFIETNFQNMANDMSKNPFFIFDDSGNLPLIPFCWLTEKIKSPKINTNHLYDVNIKAQAKVYVY